MEVWLKSSTRRFRLPVIPSEYTVTNERGDESVNINSMGEVDLAGNRKLKSVSWSCFFPYEYDAGYCQYSGFPSPQKCVSAIEAMMHAGPVKVIITGTPVKFWTRITSFEWGERDGSGDIYYSITLREHRTVAVSSSSVAADESLLAGTSANTTTQRTVPETETITHTVSEPTMPATAIARQKTGSTKNVNNITKEDGTKPTIREKIGNWQVGLALKIKNARAKPKPFGTSTTHTGAGGITFGGKTGRKF